MRLAYATTTFAALFLACQLYWRPDVCHRCYGAFDHARVTCFGPGGEYGVIYPKTFSFLAERYPGIRWTKLALGPFGLRTCGAHRGDSMGRPWGSFGFGA